jgi:hypothetical protein
VAAAQRVHGQQMTPGQSPSIAPTQAATSVSPAAGPAGNVQQYVEKCSQLLDKIHALTQPRPPSTPPTVQQTQQFVGTLIAHLRAFLLQCPPRDIDAIALAMGKVALKRFMANPIFHSKPEDSTLLALGCEVSFFFFFNSHYSVDESGKTKRSEQEEKKISLLQLEIWS